MKKIMALLLVFTTMFTYAFAGYTTLELKNGSVLVYAVKQGQKSFLYTITIKEWENATTSFTWLTNEKPQARKGTTTLDKYYSLNSNEFFAGIGKSVTEILKETQTRLIAPSALNDYLLEETDYVSFNVNENGKIATISSDVATIEDYQEKTIKYNGVDVTAKYAQVVSSDKKTELGFTLEENDYKYFLAYYRSDALTMDLISIKTGVTGKAKDDILSKLSLPPSLDKKPVTLTMDATKLAAVKKVYPLLATVESYDVTNGGKDPKPFSETYDFRLTSGAGNPPSAIDCFTADLQILYKQRKNFDLLGMPENISKNKLPSASAEMLMNIYLKKEARNVPGYKPWTHWKFVRSLTQSQLSQLAIELEGYIKQYGFTE
jgi:hypothetical protein